jgi:hypothetical protein
MDFPSSGWMPQYDVRSTTQYDAARAMPGVNFAPVELRDPVMRWMDSRLNRLEHFGERPSSPRAVPYSTQPSWSVDPNQGPRLRDPPAPPSMDQWMSVWSKIAPPSPLSVDEVRSLGKPRREGAGPSAAGPLARRIRR